MTLNNKQPNGLGFKQYQRLLQDLTMRRHVLRPMVLKIPKLNNKLTNPLLHIN